MALEPGTRLGPYEITAQIGVGGMGEVYRATDTNLKRAVAIKVLPDAVAADSARLGRFQREAEVLARLNHPNIAQIHGLERSDGTTALVMELIEGEDLSQRIARGPLPLDEALAIARQIAEALEAAHEQGIVHRDLKPANVKVKPDGTVKVLDFGLAKALDPDQPSATTGSQSPAPSAESPTMTSPALTQMGVILGTAAYMSPEQAKGRPVDARADVWAFGAILYEMVTGQCLFAAETVGESMAAVLTREPDWSPVPGRARRLLQACLQKDPKRRVRHVADAFLLLDPVEDTSVAGRTRPLLPRVAGAVVAGTIIGAVAMVLWPRGPAVAPLAFHELFPEGIRSGQAPQVSPDGQFLAVLASGADGRSQIWLRALTDETSHLIEGTSGATTVFWSPDSLEVGFANGEELRRVPRAGGVPRLVVAGVKADAGVWTPGGDIVFSGSEGLYRVEDAGGAASRMLAGRTGLYTDLSLLPSGRQVIFRQFGGETGVYVLDLDSESVTKLDWDAAATAARGAVSFVTPDIVLYRDSQGLVGRRLDLGRLMMVGDPFPIVGQVGSFAGSAAGAISYLPNSNVAARLNWRDRDGRLLQTVGAEGDYRQVRLSPSGRRMMFVRADPVTGNLDLWMQDQQAEAPIRFTTDPDVDHLAIFSPKEDEVIWEGHRGGALTVFRRRSDLSDAVRIERQWNRSGGPSDWSPDGTFALYASMEAATHNDLWVIPFDGTTEPFPLVASEFDESDGRISRDGRWLAYVSDASGRQEIYVQRLDHWQLVGGPVPVSSGGGTQPRWRADGSELFYLRDEAVMAVTMALGSDQPVGATRTLFSSGVKTGDHSYAVSPDGQRFLIIEAGQSTELAAVVVLHWSDGLPKR